MEMYYKQLVLFFEMVYYRETLSGTVNINYVCDDSKFQKKGV